MSRLKTIIDANIKENGNQEITGKTMNYVLTEIANDVNTDGYFPNMSVGFADNLVGRGESVPAEFTFRATGGKSIKDGAARIKRIKGNSVVWNNMVDTRGYEAGFLIREGIKIQQGHKYLLQRSASNGSMYFIPVVDGSESYDMVLRDGEHAKIFVSQYTDTTDARVFAEGYCGACVITDLTQMFQAGNEPTTIEEYNARKPIVADEHAYNEGEVIHMNTESIKSVGDNAWDEQWRLGFYLSGQYIDSPTQICSKNPIQVLPNESYCINQEHYYVWYYDKEMQFIGYNVKFNSYTFVTPSNAAYIHFNLEPPYGVTYKNDIIVTLVHSGWKQDTDAGYQEYWEDTLPLPIISKYFPDGMKSAGSAHDEIRFNKASGKWEAVQQVTSLDLGTLAWDSVDSGHFYVSDVLGDIGYSNLICAKYSTGIGAFSGMPADKVIGNNPESPYNNAIFVRDDAYTDATTFKESLQGVILYYELAEPIVTEIDEPFGTDYRVADFGTEQAQSSVPSAAFRADIIYQFNAVDMIRELWLKVQELEKRL